VGRAHSVGTKLVAVICLSLAIVSGLIYMGLAQREKVNLLRAKQMAGEMVVELFAQSVSASLLFDDRNGVSETLHFLGKNQEVAYAAVWKRSASEPNKLTERIAELRRGSDHADYAIPAPHDGRRVSLSEQALTISEAVKDPTGVPVGQALVVLSLAREQRLFAELSRRVLFSAVATATLIAALLVGFTRVLVVRRLSQLASAARQLERGEAATIDRGANDEVGQLAHALSRMAQAIADREARIQTQNHDMRLVLDHVAQGFITVGIDGVMSSEHSAIIDTWFGQPQTGTTFVSYLTPHAAQYADGFDVGLMQLCDDILPTDMALGQFPKRFASGALTFDVTYTPIYKGEKIASLLVIISDVTEHVAHQRAEREQKELVGLFQRISIDRTGVEEFLTEAANLVGVLRAEQDPTVQQRLVHTLKGNCAVYGLESYAELADQIESELAETHAGLSTEQREELVRMWKEIIPRVSQLLGAARRDSIEIERSELAALLARARTSKAFEIVTTLTEWEYELIERRLVRLARQVIVIARRLSKPAPQVDVEGNGIRLAPAGWTPFWTAMVHVLRNAVDHGIEDVATRVAAGKPEAGHITLTARRHEGKLIISICDDGAGVDWAKAKLKAASAGLASSTHEDLVEALFTDGISTRDQASAVSGRGVGLSAFRQVVLDLGGRVEVQSEPGHGTTLTTVFEERRVIILAANAPSLPPSSLMPRFG
jgi:two-component system chemotaxis sensor kinase CheA